MERADKTSLLMDEFSTHLMTSCCNVIKECVLANKWTVGGGGGEDKSVKRRSS